LKNQFKENTMIEEETKLDDCIETLELLKLYIKNTLDDGEEVDSYYVLYIVEKTLQRVKVI